ncbi:hypothetical protein ACJX0J_000365 (mitochondrion) [Zea mays]
MAYFLKAVGPNHVNLLLSIFSNNKGGPFRYIRDIEQNGRNSSRFLEKGPILQYHDWKIENLNVKMAPVATFMATLFVGLNMRKGSKRKGDESILHYTTRVREEA